MNYLKNIYYYLKTICFKPYFYFTTKINKYTTKCVNFLKFNNYKKKLANILQNV